MYCTNCGAKISEKAVYCVHCGESTQQEPSQRPLIADDTSVRMLVPVGRSGLSIFAGYLGLFSLMPFVGVLSMIVGMVAMRDLKEDAKRYGLGRAWFGVIMGVLTTIFWCWFFSHINA